MPTLSYWNMPSSEELMKMELSTLQENLEAFNREAQELKDEYNFGDRDMYPPDWYDQYIFPIERAIWAIEDVISELENDEDSEEEY